MGAVFAVVLHAVVAVRCALVSYFYDKVTTPSVQVYVVVFD